MERDIRNFFTDSSDILTEFKDAYEFFPDIFLSGWLIAILLSSVGVLIVARKQIFIGAAITQTSTFAIAIALYVLGLEAMSDATGQARQDLILRYSIIAACICTSAAFVNKNSLFSFLRKLKIPISVSKESTHKSHESITGWLFLFSSAGAIVLISKSPIGKEIIDKLLFSSIIGAEKQDVNLLLTLIIVSAILLALFIDKITLVFTDRDYAVSIRIPATRIELGFALLAGVILGTTLKISGTLYTFGCLILPVLISANLTKSTRSLFIISPLVAFFCAFIGFAAGNYYDIPQTQLSVFIMSLLFIPSLLAKKMFFKA